MQTDMIDVIKQRRSVRKFKAQGVEPEKLAQVLKAGLYAPSSMNKKPVEFIVTESRETIIKLKACKNVATNGLDTAPCAVVIIADSRKSDVWVEDAAIAATLIQLEAESLGLGSVWIQIRNRQSSNGSAENAVKAALNIPGNYGVLAVVAIGYKDEEKAPYDDSSLDFSKVHRELY